jgi:5-formyltetrahydrofolate cyclo-ligase
VSAHSGSAWDKEGLRARMQAERAAILPLVRLALSERIEQRLAALPEVVAASRVFLFSSFGTEVPTQRMIRRFHAEGKTVLLPYIRGGEMGAAPFPRGAWLVETEYGPKEPHNPFGVPPSEIELAVVPGLAFGRDGTRVGYGAGHYDRYLARMDPAATRVGIAFAVQLLDSVPSGPADERLDHVVTDEETVDCGRPKG